MLQSNGNEKAEWISLVTRYLWIVVAPTLLFLGTVGNVLSIIVLSRRNLRGSQASLYLIALSITDIVVLYSGLLRHLLRQAALLDVRHISEFGCKLNIMMVYSSLDISVWILVAFTFERILSVYLPHKIRTYCTRVSSCLVIGIIVFIFVALNSHFLFGFGIVKLQVSPNNSHYIPCNPLTGEYSRFIKSQWPWIDFSVFNLVPCLVFIFGNTCIVFKVLASRRKAKRVSPSDSTGTPNAMLPGSVRPEVVGMQLISPRANKTSSMTAVLVLLNFLFLVTTTPVSVYFIVESKWLREAKTKTDHALMELTFTVVNLIMYINNATNFVLYCITGSRFRRELKFMFFNKKNRVHPEGNEDVANREPHQDVVVHQRTASTILAPPAPEDCHDTRL